MTGGIIDITEHNVITPGIVIIICCLGRTAGIPLISDAEWYQSRWHNKNDGSRDFFGVVQLELLGASSQSLTPFLHYGRVVAKTVQR